VALFGAGREVVAVVLPHFTVNAKGIFLNLCYSRHMIDVIQADPEVMGGTPVFKGTRVPIQTLFDYIQGEETIDEFLEDFPTVRKEQVIDLLEHLKTQAIQTTRAA